MCFTGGNTAEKRKGVRYLEEVNIQKQDIFDKLFHLPVFRWLEPFYKKHKEVLLYLFFGGCTFLISVISYSVMNAAFGIHELVANLISWVLAVLFAFFTNRTWVFEGHTDSARDFFSQMIAFFGGRVITLVMEEIILLVFITMLGLPGIGVKIVAQIIVILANYIISKVWVFKENQ